MAEEEKNNEEESGGKKKGGSKIKLIIIILLVLIILGVLGGAGYMMFLKPKADETEQSANTKKKNVPKKEVSAGNEIGMLYPFETFIVNMADSGGTRYLKVTLQAELDQTKNLVEIMDKRKPQLRDSILTVLASKRYEEVSSAQGKLILKQEIIRRVNSLMTEGSIVNVYFTEFVAQ
jgi:flagellar FliL protein